MSRMSCALTANFATAAVLSDTTLNWPWIAHVSGCLRCQAHMASVRATRRRLGEMRKETASTPANFDPSVLRLDPPSTVSKSTVRKSTVTQPVATTSGSGAGRQMAAVSAAIAAVVLAAAWMWRRTQVKSG